MVIIQSFRHDFSGAMKANLEQFTQAHYNEPRKQYQQSWNKWTQTHQQIFIEECGALHKQGFEGDPMDKLYKSARYYFRKKNLGTLASQRETCNQEEKERTYIRIPRKITESMVTFIKQSLENSVQGTKLELSQQNAFCDYVTQHKDLIFTSLVKQRQEKGSLEENMDKRLKKAFRNKFYAQRLVFLKNITS